MVVGGIVCGEKQLRFSFPKGSCFCSENGGGGGGRVGAGSRADGWAVGIACGFPGLEPLRL